MNPVLGHRQPETQMKLSPGCWGQEAQMNSAVTNGDQVSRRSWLDLSALELPPAEEVALGLSPVVVVEEEVTLGLSLVVEVEGELKLDLSLLDQSKVSFSWVRK
jgi:hypothetical protein